MTRVIHATTGLQGIGCGHADEGDQPDGTKPDTPEPVDGSDGYETPDMEADPVERVRRGLSFEEGHTVWISGGPGESSSSAGN